MAVGNAENISVTGVITFDGSNTWTGSAVTQFAPVVGAASNAVATISVGSSGQVLQSSGAGVNPAYSTATYPATTTINQLLFSSATNTVGGLATANQAVLTTNGSGVPVLTALATNGQIIIGSTAGVPAAATLTGGTGITITNASNSITIANTNASGFPWTDVTTATQTLAVNNGYVTDRGGGVTYTLPATAALGDTMKILGKAGITTIAQNANQQIIFSAADSTVGVGGSAVGTDEADCVELICSTAGASTVWTAFNFVGNWTIT